MKNAPAAVTSFLAGLTSLSRPYRADLYSFTLLDGTILRWTTADLDLPVSGNTWSKGFVLNRSNLRQSSQLRVDTLDVTLAGAAVVSGKTLALQAMLDYFNGARLQIDHLVGTDPANAIANTPVMAWFEGRVAAVDPGPIEVRVVVHSELEALNQQLPRFLFQPTCSHAVYDPNCGLVVATFTLAGTATGGTTTTATSTTAGIIAKANSWFKYGVLRFTSGALNGVRADVQDFSVTAGVATFTFTDPLAVAPSNGDTFSVYPGCPRTVAACQAFPNAVGATNNLVNIRAFPHIPSPESKR